MNLPHISRAMNVPAPGRTGAASVRKQCGLTAIELLIVLAIAALVLNIAAPPFSAQLSEMRSQAALRHLSSLFNYARYYALTHNVRTTVCALNGERRCVREWRREHEITVFIDGNANRRLEPGERRLRVARWPMSDGELSWRASLARPYIDFQTTGGTWQNGTLYYCPANRDARRARALVISHSGRSYLPGDSNGDGINEDRRGRNLSC